MKIKALKGKVLVSNIEGGMRTINGIIIPDDNGKSEGIRPRWAQVYSIGSDIKDIMVGQWILVEHSRWTRAMVVKDGLNEIKVWGVEYPKAVMCVSDTKPSNVETFSTWTGADRLTR